MMDTSQNQDVCGQIPADIVDILKQSNSPRTVSDIQTQLRLKKINLPSFKVTRALRAMQMEGMATIEKGKWALNGNDFGSHEFHIVKDLRPIISPIATSLIHDGTQTPSVYELLNRFIAENPDKSHVEPEAGPWTRFRRLLAYYKDCIRSEEGAESSAYMNELNEKFVFIDGIGEWYPKTGKPWSISIPQADHLHKFNHYLSNLDSESLIMLGYPLQLKHVQKDNEPDVTFVTPVFQYILKIEPSSGWRLSTEDAQPEICYEWLKYAFKGYHRQYAFLTSTGLLQDANPDDDLGMVSHSRNPVTLDELANSLIKFLPQDRIQDKLNPKGISGSPLRAPYKSGIYNKAVIIVGKRTQYTKTLISELSEIAKMPDDVLDRTALKLLFRDRIGTIGVSAPDTIHEALVADTFPLNAMQREAVSNMLQMDSTVITGPPGTGKSQVVTSLIKNSRIRGKSVLFCSRNHKAIDAVVNRAFDDDQRSLIIRANSKEDPSLKYTFASAIKDLLTGNADIEAKIKYEEYVVELNILLKERGELGTQANYIQHLKDQLGEQEQRLSMLAQLLAPNMVANIDLVPSIFPLKSVEKLQSLMNSLNSRNDDGILLGYIRLFITKIRVALNPWLHRLQYKPYMSQKKLIVNSTGPDRFESKARIALFRAKEYAKIRLKSIEIEDQLKPLPRLEALTDQIKVISDRIKVLLPNALQTQMDCHTGLPSGDERREQFSSLLTGLGSLSDGFSNDTKGKKIISTLREFLPELLEYFPCWAVTNLSVGSRIPLFAGMFDQAVIDEASQSDIPSAIPILFRSKKATMVGDPYQLTHVSNLTVGKDSLLRQRSGLIEMDDLKFSYVDNSIYDLFARSKWISPVFLSDTYRSAFDIADYSNRTFYNGKLVIATDGTKLKSPPGLKPGIHWTDIESTIRAAGGGGCFSMEEVATIYDIVEDLLLKKTYSGTIGIIAPFRNQANRLQDRIFGGGIPQEKLTHAALHVDTAHGFQGDERDLIIFSLCSGSDMPRGSLGFIKNKPNLFNVAVSRARAVLHVVGNRTWAQNCGIKHIQNLAIKRDPTMRTASVAPWAPYESPWEQRLAEAMQDAGLEPIPQYSIAGRRLDLALIRDKQKPIKIDIEVDGDRYHRNPDGSRKSDDIWRDTQMQSLGWKVIRFWVYELREDMQGCIAKIRKAYNDE